MAILSAAIFGAVALILLGLAAPAPSVPLADFIRAHRVPSALASVVLAGFSLWAWAVYRSSSATTEGSGRTPVRGLLDRAFLLRVLTVLTLISVGLTTVMGVLIIRPDICQSWRLTWICPTHYSPNGVHDSNMELFLFAIQTPAIVLEKSPDQYAPKTLPSDFNAVAAAKIGARSDTESYKVVLGVHNLQQNTPYSTLIERVRLIIDSIPASPFPLNVYSTGDSVVYQGEPFLSTYGGQTTGAGLSARYEPLPVTHVQLSAGEPDTLAIKLVSDVQTTLTFHIALTYQIANESGEHELVLPHRFQVVFSDGTNWHPYKIQDGHLVPGA